MHIQQFPIWGLALLLRTFGGCPFSARIAVAAGKRNRKHRTFIDDEKYKYVIASATPILPLYQEAYGDRVNFVGTSPVELQGKLHLHRERSYSKSSILEMGNDFAPAVDEFVEEYLLDGIITHKDFVTTVDSKAALRRSKGHVHVSLDLWCHGGLQRSRRETNWRSENTSLARACIEATGACSWNTHSWDTIEFDCRTVRRHEFEVSLWCVSDDEFAQSIEFGLVERELVQAGRRARLPENDCEVHLWSNYVLSWRRVVAEGQMRFYRDARRVEGDRLTKRSSKVSTKGMVLSGAAPKIATRVVTPERNLSGQRWPRLQLCESVNLLAVTSPLF